MYRILISDPLGAAGLERLDQADDATYDVKTNLSKEALLAILPEYDALILRSGTTADAEALAAATKLKVIGRAGIGVDQIDVLEATRRGIIVINTPEANSITTAEYAMALIMAASRHIVAAHTSLLHHEWKRSDFIGTQLHGKRLGIIGFGHIGRLLAKRALAFGMEVMVYDPYVSEEVGRDLGVILVDLEDLLVASDYISLHAAVTPETTHIINASTINQMKDGVIFINAARGKLVDENALAAALQNGKIKAAALDVYAQEPPSEGNPLIGMPNVLHTPHLGANTYEAQHAVATEIVDQVLDALRGSDYRNAINMPFQAGPGFQAIRPYMKLAEKLGNLHAGLAEGLVCAVEVEVHGDAVTGLVRAIAAALLKGLLEGTHDGPLNYINAPILADERGITTSQTVATIPVNYPNLISCRVQWDGGQRLLAGVLFGGSEPRIVRVDEYELEARPEGAVLVMQNLDVPGVIGQIGTILGAYGVNIGEWRMGRDRPGGEALSFINLDSVPPDDTLNALAKITAVTQIKLVTL